MSSDVMKESKYMPMARWEGEPADPAVLADSFRFPYACNLVTPNRIMKSAMSEQLATFVRDDMSKSGIPTEELINLYKKFGEGGFGTIVTGSIMVNGKDLEAPGDVIIDKDYDTEERRDAFKRWAAAGKAHGSLMIAQLFHPGKYAANLPNKSNFDTNSITREEIRNLIEEYAFAAKFAQDCGFDGVEIHSAYFFTLGQFITDGANSRTDEFGGSLENRSRLLFNIMQKLRMRLPRQSNFVIGVKFYSGNFEPGYNEDEFSDFVHSVEKTGFDYVTITGGHYNLLRGLPKDGSGKHEHFYQTIVPAIKKNLTRTKLFMNGNFVTLSDMCDAIKERWAAGVSLAKPVAAEPDMPKKLLSGQVRGAVKSLIDPIDFLAEQQVAGTQMWQHAMNLEVMDPSNPADVEEFNKALTHYNELQLNADETGADKINGYPRVLLEMDRHRCPEMKDIYGLRLAAIPTAPPANVGEKFEEEIHEVVEKPVGTVPSPVGMHEQTISDSFRTYEKRYEDGGNVEIIEESYEKVTTSNIDYVEPPKDFMQKAIPAAPEPEKVLEPEHLKDVFEEAVKAVLKPEEVAAEPKVEAYEMKKEEVPPTLAAAEAPSIEEYWKENFEEGANKILTPEEPVTVQEEIAMKLHEEFMEAEKELSPKESEIAKEIFGEEVQKVVQEELGQAPAPEKPEEGKLPTPAELKETLHEIIGDITTFNNLEEGVMKEEPEVTVEAKAPTGMQEIIAGITSDNKEIIAGLQEAKPAEEVEEIQKVHVTADAAQKSDEIPFEKVSDSSAVFAKAAPETTAAFTKLEAGLFEQHPEDVEEKFEKVVLENVSLAGLISDIILPSSSEDTQSNIEASEVEKKIEVQEVQKSPEEKEAEVKPETAATSEAFAKVEASSEQQPEDVEEKIEKVVLENISLAGLISDFILPTPAESTESKVETTGEKEKTEAPAHLEGAEKVEEVPAQKEAEVKLEAAPTLEAAAKTETHEEHPEDVEEKIEKVVLENISLAGLISDFILPSPAEGPEPKVETTEEKEKTEAPAQLESTEKVEEVPAQKEAEVKLEAVPTLEAAPKVEIQDEHPEDVEEKIEKVVLENISLAGLISDFIKSVPADDVQAKPEVFEAEPKPEPEKVEGLPVEAESEAKLETVQATEATPKVEAAGEQAPEDVEEKFEKVVLENVSLAGLISDLLFPSSDEKKDKVEAAEETVEKPVEAPKLEAALEATPDQFKDVKQWLVFNKEEKELPLMETSSAPLEAAQEPKSVKDEFKDVKQWLVFNKEEPSTAAAASEKSVTAEAPVAVEDASVVEASKVEKEPKSVKDEFKEVKQWLVFNKEEPSTAAAASEKSVTAEKPVAEEAATHAEFFDLESVPTPPKALSPEEFLEPEADKLTYEELAADKDSPTTHKKMFGSSLPEDEQKDEMFKAETSVQFSETKDAFGEPRQMQLFSEEQFKDFDQPSESTFHTTYTYESTTETAVKPEEKKSGGLSGFFKSAFSDPVQKLFSDTKDKAEAAADEFFDVSGEAGNASSLQEVMAGTTSLEQPGGVVEVEETTTTMTSGTGRETTTVTKTTKSKKRSSGRYSKKDRKGAEEHGFEFI